MIIYKNSHKEQILICALYGCFFVTVNSNVSFTSYASEADCLR